jgi:hypothetical protein
VRTGQNATYPLRADHANTALKLADVGGSLTLTAQAFYVITDVDNEWVKTTYNSVTGWVWIADDFYVGWDDTEMVCVTKIPTEYASGPTSTPVPTQPGPTPTAIPPIPVGCTVYNFATFSKNVREAHSLTSTVAFEIPAGGSAVVKQFYTTSAEKWASVLYTMPVTGVQLGGWAAVTVSGTTIYELRGDCGNVPSAPRAIAVGWHNTLRARWEPQAPYAATYSVIKTTTGTEWNGLAFKSLNPSGVWIHRSLYGEGGAGNCPTFEWTSPTVWVDRFWRTWPQGVSMVEGINECGLGPGAETFASFNIAMLKKMGELGFCGLAFSFEAGVPDFQDWPKLVPVLTWIDTNPCKYENGQPVFHGIAMHGSFCSPVEVPGNPWVSSPYLCNRIKLVRDDLLKRAGYDLVKFKGPIVFSEQGVDDGYSGTTGTNWSVEQFLSMVNYSLNMYEADGLVDMILVWNLGDGGAGQWVDRESWVAPLAALLQSRLQ